MLGSNVGIYSPQFIADFLVSHIKPSVELVTKKFGNLTVQSRVTRLFPSNDIPDLLSYTRNNQIAIIDSMKNSLPSWFNSDSYISKLQGQLKYFLEENKELSSIVDELQDQPDFKDLGASKVFRDAIILLGDKMNDWYKQYENHCANLLLISDIPVDYFLISKNAELAQISSFRVYRTCISTLSTRLSIARDFVKYSQNAQHFKHELSPLLGAGRLVSDSLAKLNFFLDVSNSNNLDDLFRLTPYLQSRTDSARLTMYLEELETMLANMSEELISKQGFVHEPMYVSEATNQLQQDLANVILS